MLLPLQARQLWTIVVQTSHRHPLPSLAQVLGSHALQGPHSWYRQLQVQQVRRVSCLCEDLTQATPLRVERTTINVNNYACVVGMTSGVAISSESVRASSMSRSELAAPDERDSHHETVPSRRSSSW